MRTCRSFRSNAHTMYHMSEKTIPLRHIYGHLYFKIHWANRAAKPYERNLSHIVWGTTFLSLPGCPRRHVSKLSMLRRKATSGRNLEEHHQGTALGQHVQVRSPGSPLVWKYTWVHFGYSSKCSYGTIWKRKLFQFSLYMPYCDLFAI